MPTSVWNDTTGYTKNHQLRWHRGGAAFFDYLAELIDSAQNNIHFQVYLIDSDFTGNQIMNALIRAALRGVEVNLVVDGFGSGKLGKTDEKKLTDAGINFKRFEPYVSGGKFYVGRRMHHKVLVIDHRIGVVGGMNVADRYRGSDTYLPWMDYAISVEGPVVDELVSACKRILERTFLPSSPKWFKISKINLGIDTNETWARMRKNDWLRNRKEISAGYNKAVRLAGESILIVGGYFLPGRKFLRLLGAASKRGVKIQIILTSFSDVPVVKKASEYLYDRLLKNNIQIYEASKAMVHGKVAVVDQTWATIGSYNQNHLSAYISIELNIDVVSQDFSSSLHRHLTQVIQQECFEITNEDFVRKSTLPVRLIRRFCYQLVRLSLRLLFVMNRIFSIHD